MLDGLTGVECGVVAQVLKRPRLLGIFAFPVASMLKAGMLNKEE